MGNRQRFDTGKRFNSGNGDFDLKHLSRIRRPSTLVLMGVLIWIFSCGAVWAQEPDPLLLLEADRVYKRGDVTIAEGNVRLEIKGARLDCQRLEFDSRSKLINASRECVFSWGQNYAASERLTYDLDKEEAVLYEAAGRGDELVHQNRLVESSLYFWADRLRWTPEKVVLDEALLTTCELNPDDFHYAIESEQITVFPRDKLVASNTAISLHDNRLYTVPTIVVPLDEDKQRQRQSYFPSAGYNNLDGVFLRNRFDYYIDKGNYGSLNLDAYQRSGLGYGLESFFELAPGTGGNIFYYTQNGQQAQRNRFELRGNAQVRIDEFTNLGFAYNSNQFELPGVVSPLNVASVINLSRITPGSSLQVAANFADSGDNRNSGYRFFYDVELDDRWSGILKADLSRSVVRVTETNRYHYLGGVRYRGDLFDGDLALERAGGQLTYFLNREPELRLRSHRFQMGPVPLTASASLGRLQESPSQFSTERYRMELVVPDQIMETAVGNLHVGAGLLQNFYGSGQQQYVVGARAGWLSKWGENAVARLDYNWQRPQGFTPFQHDLVFPYQTVNGGLEIFEGDVFSISASGGYDMEFGVPYDIIGRLQVKPTDRLRINAAANYDPTTRIWRNVDSGVTAQLTDGISMTHWSVYDLVNSRLTYQNFALNYEDHDWLASLAYRGVQNEIFFQMSLKAFPLRQTKIGPDPALPILPVNLQNPFTR